MCSVLFHYVPFRSWAPGNHGTHSEHVWYLNGSHPGPEWNTNGTRCKRGLWVGSRKGSPGGCGRRRSAQDYCSLGLAIGGFGSLFQSDLPIGRETRGRLRDGGGGAALSLLVSKTAADWLHPEPVQLIGPVAMCKVGQCAMVMCMEASLDTLAHTGCWRVQQRCGKGCLEPAWEGWKLCRRVSSLPFRVDTTAT